MTANPSKPKQYMRRKLISIIVLTLAIGLGLMSFFSIQHNIENIESAEENKIDLLSDVLTIGIKNAMVTGNAPIVIGWLEGIKKSNGLVELKDFHRSGKEAFVDNETRSDVNKWLGTTRFPLHIKPKTPAQYNPERMNAFKEAVDTALPVSFDEEIDGEPVHTRLVPILRDQRCILCHGYEDHPVRSILQISVSKAVALETIQGNMVWATLSSLIVILLIGIVMSLLINREVIRPITDAISKVSQAADNQDTITSQQASSVHEITATIEELRASSKQVNTKAESLAEQSQEALSVAHEGQRSIDESIDEMKQIKEKVAEIAGDVLTLSENTNQIGAIINVVGDIANKTDMLVVNAAIEAAKAGEHGKGFAVVASEVRSLAFHIIKAAEKIENLVQEIQHSVNSTVMTMEEGGKKVDVGVNHILLVRETINNTIETISATADAANEIAIASRQESLANTQVAEAMGQINRGMQDSSTATKDALHSIQQLQGLIDRRVQEDAS